MAKEIIQKTLVGFGLFLLSWLIIFTLLSLLSANTSMIGKGDNGIFQFTCDDDSAFYVEPQDNDDTDSRDNDDTNARENDATLEQNDNDNRNQEPIVVNPTTDDARKEAENRTKLRLGNVDINHGRCPRGETRGCTNVGGLKDVAIEGVIGIKKDCPSCTVMITGGSEGGHKTHSDGRHIDLRPTSSLNRHMTGESNYKKIIENTKVGDTTNGFTRIADTPGVHGGPTLKDKNGNTYVLEGVTTKGREANIKPHWHSSF